MTTKKRKRAASKASPAVNNLTAAARLDAWSVVLTGEFTGSQEELEEQLKSRGAEVTSAVSSKTTHLILGISGKNKKSGKITGVGSKKYADAEERGLLILQERDVHVVLDMGEEEEELKPSPLKKPAKVAKMIKKIIYVLRKEGVGVKVSIALLKAKLIHEWDYLDFAKGPIKAGLKKALAKGLHENILVQPTKSSYQLLPPPYGPPGDDPPKKRAPATIKRKDDELDPDYSDDDDDDEPVQDQDLTPVTGRWLGIEEYTRRKGKSGLCLCKACGEKIRKGTTQLEVLDDSLFEMLAVGNNRVQRGYGIRDVQPRKYQIHEACFRKANKMLEAKFHEEWSRVRKHLIRNRANA